MAIGKVPGRPHQTETQATLDKASPDAQAFAMPAFTPRIAARALILHQDRLLLVNAYPDRRLGLWCAPGGGCEAGQSLPANLAREVMEETGLSITVGPPVLVNEFHDPDSGFHQVDLFFRCTLAGGKLCESWIDPEGIVTDRRFFTRAELDSGGIRFKPDSLPLAAWGDGAALYDPLEVILK